MPRRRREREGKATDPSKAAERAVSNVSRVVGKVNKRLRTEFNILSQEIVIDCPENTQEYHAAIEVQSGRLSTKIPFPYGRPRRFSLRPIRSMQDVSAACVPTEEGFFLDTRQMKADDLYLLDVEYPIADPTFLESIVKRTVARELPSHEKLEYWMHAEIKSLKALRKEYRRLDLHDVDFGINVGVHQQISLAVPTVFKQELETIVKWVKETQRERKQELSRRHLQQQRHRHAGKEGDVLTILQSLQGLFSPTRFEGFVDVKKEFHYESCFRGPDFYEGLPMPTWPRHMRVISRTDLSFSVPAAEGLLVYKKKSFEEELDRVFR